jgi:hypothetical protein
MQTATTTRTRGSGGGAEGADPDGRRPRDRPRLQQHRTHLPLRPAASFPLVGSSRSQKIQGRIKTSSGSFSLS